MAFKSCTQLALLTLASVSVMGMLVEAKTVPICTELLGPCNLMNCQTECRSKHPGGGSGKCDITKMCKCDYPCSPGHLDSPAEAPAQINPIIKAHLDAPATSPAKLIPIIKTCRGNLGFCGPNCKLDCCQNKCKTAIKGAVGHCEFQAKQKVTQCNCDYPC